jgi:hypothetical protein
MTAESPRVPQAERFGAIVDAALAAWAARWPLYLALAATSVGIELLAATLAHYRTLSIAVVLSVVDGFGTALVSLDVAARFRGESRSPAELVRSAVVRWPLVALLLVLILLLDAQLYSWIFGTAEETLYGMLILPALAALGIFGVATAIASLESSLPLPAVPGYALMRSIVYAASWPNLGRLTVAGAMVAVPLMLQQLLGQWLGARGLGAGPAFFWSNVPVDALCLAPFQAFFTYLYFDFTVREQKR